MNGRQQPCLAEHAHGSGMWKISRRQPTLLGVNICMIDVSVLLRPGSAYLQEKFSVLQLALALFCTPACSLWRNISPAAYKDTGFANIASASGSFLPDEGKTPKAIGSELKCTYVCAGVVRHWLHSEMWWTRLFRHQCEIAWDDYEKDYSDLPHEVLQRYNVMEAQREACRQLEAAEKTAREALEVQQLPLQIECTACLPILC